MENENHLKNYLTDLLNDLEFIEENSGYHPEENVLAHSLQVFELAYHTSSDPELWAAALFHDIGKAIDHKQHAEVGADLLNNLLSPRIAWLVKHHLDLLKTPKKTRHLLQNKPQLLDLEQLRRWDLQGRKPNKATLSVAFSIESLFQHQTQITNQNADAFYMMEGFTTTY